MKNLEERVQQLEMQQAVSAEILRRIENDLQEIAKSSHAIQNVVTRWKGALVLLILLLGGVISGLTEVFQRWTSK